MLTPGTVFCASGSSRDGHGSSYGAPPTSASKLVHARDLRFTPPTPKRPLKSMVFEPCSIWPGDCEPRCPDRGSGSALDPEHHAELGRTQNLTDSDANVKTAGGTNALPNPVPGSRGGSTTRLSERRRSSARELNVAERSQPEQASTYPLAPEQSPASPGLACELPGVTPHASSTAAEPAAAPSNPRGLACCRQGRDEPVLGEIRGHQHAWSEGQNQGPVEDWVHGAAGVGSARGASAPRRGAGVAD